MPAEMRAFYLDEAKEYVDNTLMPPRVAREVEAAIEAEETRIKQIGAEHYTGSAKPLLDEIGFCTRTIPEGEAAVADTLDRLRAWEITPQEAAQEVAAMRRDINNARERLKQALAREDAAWEETNQEPGAYQRAVGRRSPSLHAGGRGLL
ncbi:MAG: hypothetical protein KC492_25260, partial [Myxococcales bacterium]|nr:hypothetical protein [Myxococcales bacterium]